MNYHAKSLYINQYVTFHFLPKKSLIFFAKTKDFQKPQVLFLKN